MINYIYTLTQDETLIAQGLALQEKGKVNMDDGVKSKEGLLFLSTVACDDPNLQMIRFQLQPSSFEINCACATFEAKGFCPHLVAALLEVGTKQKLLSQTAFQQWLVLFTPHQADHSSAPENAYSTMQAQHQLETASQQVAQFFLSHATASKKQPLETSINCELEYVKDGIYLIIFKLHIATYRPEKIANIQAFSKAYFQQTKRFNLSRNSFIDMSTLLLDTYTLTLLRTIPQQIANQSIFKHQRLGDHFISSSHIGSVLSLSTTFNSPLSFRFPGTKKALDYTVTTNFDALQFTVTDQPHDDIHPFLLTIQAQHAEIPKLLPGLLVQQKIQTLQVLDYTETLLLEPIITGLHAMKQLNYRPLPLTLPLSKEDLLYFVQHAQVLTIPFTTSPATQATITAESLLTKVYITRERGKIEVSIQFCYASVQFFFPHDPPKSAICCRDFSQERQIIQQLLKTPLQQAADSSFFFEDIVCFVTFLEVDVPQLQEQGIQFFIDSSIKKLKLQQPDLHVNVRMSAAGVLDVSLDSADLNITDLLQIMLQYRLKKQFVELSSGAVIDLYENQLQDQLAAFEAMQIDQLFEQHSPAPPLYRSFELADFAQHSPYVHVDDTLIKMKQDILSPHTAVQHLPNHLLTLLRPYQLTGVYWLQQLTHYGLGGVLADDMGLGKTLQTIAFLSSQKRTKPALIVAPKTLVYNWQKEFTTFAPSLRTTLIIGNATERKELLESVSDDDILITSYPLLAKDITSFSHDFSFIFIDEAQQIKNPNTLAAIALKQLRADHRFALTGTPLENNLLEIWSIFDFIMPGFLGTQKSFIDQTIRPLQKDMGDQALGKLKQKIHPFMLRRLKSVVLSELPEKIQTPIYCQMDEEQKRIYQHYFIQTRKELSFELAQHGFAKSQIKILALITRLRQVCVHPQLFLDNYTGTSTKLETLKELIDDAITGGHKILLFSQFTTMLQLIADMLVADGIPYLYLNGQTKAAERLDLVEQFNHDDNIPLFLLSLKAGGTGLNLTAADIVIHFDPWWNPSVENQATDRAHRFGQTNKVQVFQLVAQDTIEEKILKLKEQKQALFDSLFDSQEDMFHAISESDIKGLFDL